MGIKITSVSMTRESCQVPTNGPHRLFEAGPMHCTGEFESTVELKVGQRFAVNENRFEGLAKDDGSLQGVACVTSVHVTNYYMKVFGEIVPTTWTGTFEMEGEVTVVAND